MGSTYGASAQAGVMLTPSTGSAVWIGAATLDMELGASGAVHVIPWRESPVVVMAHGRHLESGNISGYLRDANEDGSPGNAVGAYQWVNRLRTLLVNAADPAVTVSITTRDFSTSNARFPEGAAIKLLVNPNVVYEVSLNFQAIS